MKKQSIKNLFPQIAEKLYADNLIPGNYIVFEKKVILFYREYDQYGCFSNFSPHPVDLYGIKCKTSEHMFQALKTFNQNERNLVVSAKTPGQCFKLGRNVTLRKDWEIVKDDLMYHIVKAKFSQNPEILKILIDTDNALIIEHTKNDKYWADGNNGSGYNQLGFTLMKVRDELKSELLHK